jgi:hypothetical protein
MEPMENKPKHEIYVDFGEWNLKIKNDNTDEQLIVSTLNSIEAYFKTQNLYHMLQHIKTLDGKELSDELKEKVYQRMNITPDMRYEGPELYGIINVCK